jgi:hypothetical protein
MVIFSVLYLGIAPFQAWPKAGIIAGMVRSLGPLPKQWKELYTHPGRHDSWYDQTTMPEPADELASTIARCRPEADPAERKDVQSIMSKVFRYCPERRLTAAQLLQDPSFRAIMDKYGC